MIEEIRLAEIRSMDRAGLVARMRDDKPVADLASARLLVGMGIWADAGWQSLEIPSTGTSTADKPWSTRLAQR